ncbi:MAG: hypothetical protein MUF81_04980 [Verrucomicrobia bacterium]|jgi:hypothetical protein|nr:hypothetical protein [Verrucomicrobiota bacterium]
MNPDEFKQIWKTQPLPRQITIDGDMVLQLLRRNKTSFSSGIFWADLLVIPSLLGIAGVFVLFSIWLRREGLPMKLMYGFLLFALIQIAVAGYKGFDRIRQIRRRPAASDSVVSCAQETLDLVRHEIRLWSKVTWWYLLPLGAGAAFMALNVAYVVGGMAALFSFSTLVWLSVPAVFIVAGRWFCRWYVRKNHEPLQREMEALLHNLQSS